MLVPFKGGLGMGGDGRGVKRGDGMGGMGGMVGGWR